MQEQCTGVPAAGWEPRIGRNRERELRKTVGVQECLRDREVILADQRQQEPGQHSQVCKVWGAGGSIRMKCSPLPLFLPTFVVFSSSSQNSYLLEQASCQDVTIEMFALDPGCDSCSTTMLGKPTPPLQVAENTILAALKITNFDSLPLQKLFSMPHYAILQSPGTKRELISI